MKVLIFLLSFMFVSSCVTSGVKNRAVASESCNIENYIHFIKKPEVHKCNLQGAKLQGVWFYKANLREANLEGADLQNADLRGANLYLANLQNTNLKNAKMHRADLQNADLQNADLRGAYLQNADLVEANLQGADLQNADLRGANLYLANLQNTNLQGANWIEAKNLQGAKLRGAKGIILNDLINLPKRSRPYSYQRSNYEDCMVDCLANGGSTRGCHEVCE